MKTGRCLIALSVALGLALACFWLLALPTQPVHAATFTVTTNIDEADGSCSDDDCSLRDAILTADWGDWIDFNNSLDGQVITLTLGQLTLDKNITIDGSSLITPTRISGNNSMRVFYILEDIVASLSYIDIISGTGDSASGGGIFNEGDLTLSHCTLAGNSTIMNGGGIYNSGRLTVNDSTLTGNSADYGGGIRNENLLTINRSTFYGNLAEWGGGIDNYAGGMTVDGSAFFSNTATYGGGGITSGASLVVASSTFEYNSSDSGGAIENHNYAWLTVEDSHFYTNTSSGVGGGIINLDGTLEVISSTLAGNTAYGGGGIGNYATLLMTGSSLTGNTADNDGGGVLNNYTGVATVTSSTFISNTAHINGGAVDNWGGALVITSTTFISNSAYVGGGIANNASSLLRMTDTAFYENSANAGGGVFNDNSSDLAVTNSGFYTNTAISGGGGIYNLSGTITVTNGTFSANYAGYGGGIRNEATMTLTLGTFEGNSADFGGAIHNVESGRLAVDRSTLSANSTIYYGAGIYNGAILTVTNSTFDNNSGDAGGGIYNDLTSWVENSTFYSNTVSGVGGGIINNNGSLTVTNSSLERNSAGSGGGIGNGASFHYRNTIISNSRNGGDCLNTGTIVENTNNLVLDGSCAATMSGDPVINNLADNGGLTRTCALLPSSPAIDAGDPATCPATDQRGLARNDWNCDIGAFELKLADSPVVAKPIFEAGVYTFGPTLVKVEVIDPGLLDGLIVTKITGDHPWRTGSAGGNGVGWGEYFTLDPNTGANDTFTANLTLPTQFPPDTNDKACRHINELEWDCAVDSVSTTPFNTITRENVTAFSDWAVGNDVSPTAVRLSSMQAASRKDGLLPALGVALIASAIALIWLRQHKRMLQ